MEYLADGFEDDCRHRGLTKSGSRTNLCIIVIRSWFCADSDSSSRTAQWPYTGGFPGLFARNCCGDKPGCGVFASDPPFRVLLACLPIPATAAGRRGGLRLVSHPTQVARDDSLRKVKVEEKEESLAPRILPGARYACAQAILDCFDVTSVVHRAYHSGRNSAGRRGFVQQFFKHGVFFAPGDDAVGEAVCGGDESCFSIEAEFLGSVYQRGQRVIAVAGGICCGEDVELAFRNFDHRADSLEEIFNLLSSACREAGFECDRGQAATRASNRAWHGSHPAHG